jgi:hypothetical protein
MAKMPCNLEHEKVGSFQIKNSEKKNNAKTPALQAKHNDENKKKNNSIRPCLVSKNSRFSVTSNLAIHA